MKALRALPRPSRPSRRALLSVLLLGIAGALLGSALGLLGRGDSGSFERVQRSIADQTDARLILRAALEATPPGLKGNGVVSGTGKRYEITTALSGQMAGLEIIGIDGSLYLWSDGGDIWGGETGPNGTTWQRFGRDGWGRLERTFYAPLARGVAGGADPLALLREMNALGCLDGLHVADSQDGAVQLLFFPCERSWIERLGGSPESGMQVRVSLDRATLVIEALSYEIGDSAGNQLLGGSLVFSPYSGAINSPAVSAERAREELDAWLVR